MASFSPDQHAIIVCSLITLTYLLTRLLNLRVYFEIVFQREWQFELMHFIEISLRPKSSWAIGAIADRDLISSLARFNWMPLNETLLVLCQGGKNISEIVIYNYIRVTNCFITLLSSSSYKITLCDHCVYCISNLCDFAQL